MSEQPFQQPKQVWRRAFAIAAFIHFCVYTFINSYEEIHTWVLASDIIIIGYWAIGAAAIMDILTAVNPLRKG